MRAPDFVVVGFPKCGSTTLQRYFEAHPQLYMGDIKEPSLYYDHWDAWEQGTLTYYPDDLPSKVLRGDATVGYVKHPEVPCRIQIRNPDTKIVFLVRDPIRRALSHYHHWLRHGKDIRKLQEVVRHSTTNHYFYLFSRYGYHLEVYRAKFPDQQIEVLFFEDLVRDPIAALEPIWHHLGVPPLQVLPDNIWENAGHGVQSRRLSRWLKHQKEAEIWRKVLPAWLRKPGGALLRRLEVINQSQKREELALEDEEILRKAFRVEVQALHSFLTEVKGRTEMPTWIESYL